ncbi:SpnB-like Rossmann fold domain-containing protein, partial [Mycobacterium simiae]|uniref:SpnB-like Rossmann fold domain-containing protein n=1 Tax=Mycobacterium simiae TaxID=1784 RepID=UPI0040387463
MRESLFQLDWPALPADTFPHAEPARSWVVIGNAEHLPAGLHQLPAYPDLTHPDLTDTDLAIWALPLPDGDPLHQTHDLTKHTLTQLQHWLARPDTHNTHLVILTRHAVTTNPHDPTPDLAHAATWALIHTTQNEHPNRITLLDTDNDDSVLVNILAALGQGSEPQLALRNRSAHTPRLAPTTPPQTPT